MDPASVTTAPNAAFSYPESVESSPRSRGGGAAESFDDHFPSKLRLMCSYGGRIVPRPTDKTLCYLGGDTRIISVDRHSSLADLHSKLSRSLLNNSSFTLKYQLPNEDLDSLVSVTTDEDLENMIEEYDRIVNSGNSNGGGSTKSSRIRLFLFLNKSDSSAPSSIGSLLDDSKSETWFVDALNGAINDSRGSTDSATVNCLLGLEDDSSVNSKSEVGLSNNTVNPNTNNNNNNSSNNVVGAGGDDVDRVLFRSPASSNERIGKQQEMNSIPNSPMFEKNSSFGSASSVPSLSSLPPIQTREDGQPLEEQFQQQMNLNHAPQPNVARAPAIASTTVVPAMSPTVVMPSVPTTENPNLNRFLFADDGNLDSFKQVNQSPKLVPVEAAAPVADPRTLHYQEQNRMPVHLEPKQPIQASELPAPYRIQQVPMPVLEQNFINPTLNAQEQLHLHQQLYPPQQQQQQHIHANQQQYVQFPSYYQVPHHQIQQQPQQFDPNLPIYYIPVRQNTQPLSGFQPPQPKVVHPKPDMQQSMYQTANNPVPGGYVQGMGYHVMHHHQQHPTSQAQSFVYTNAGSGIDNMAQQAQAQVYYTHNVCTEADVNHNRAS